jgi:hypothetical protein
MPFGRGTAEGDLTPDARTLVEKNRRDEDRHLQFLQVILSERAWEK